MKDLRDQVDAFRIWERTHNRENYGRYDAFKAGYDLGRNEALEEAAEEIQKDMHERFASVSHRAVCTPCDYKFRHGYYIRSLALAACVPEDT